MSSVEKLSEEQVDEASKIINDIERLDNEIMMLMKTKLRIENERRDTELLKLKRCYLFCRLDDILNGRMELDGYGDEYKGSD